MANDADVEPFANKRYCLLVFKICSVTLHNLKLFNKITGISYVLVLLAFCVSVLMVALTSTQRIVDKTYNNVALPSGLV